MRLSVFTLSLSFLLAGSALAQKAQTFTIDGTLTTDSLAHTPGRVHKLYLSHEVEGKMQAIDSTTVREGRFSFRGTAPQEVGVYHITGFDNGTVQLFLEPGHIVVQPFSAKYPVAARVSGSPTNEAYRTYQQLGNDLVEYARINMERELSQRPHLRDNTAEFLPYQHSVYHANGLYYKSHVLRYLKEHAASPMALYVLRYDLQPMFSPKYMADSLLTQLSPQLHQHSMYKELQNWVLSSQLNVGNAGPNLEGRTPSGQQRSLADLRGKYVLIDFWASWCGPCRREFPFIRQVLKATEERNNFVVLSYSIDSKENEWVNCIERNQLTHKNWWHLSVLKGWSSPAAQLYKVEAVPRTVLIDPQGNIVAFDLRGEEMVKRITALTSATAPTTVVVASPSKAQDKDFFKALQNLDAEAKSLLSQYELLTSLPDKLTFLLDHKTSPLSPLLMERDLLPIVSPLYAQRLVDVLSPDVLSHAHSRSLANEARALNLRVGALAPDVELSAPSAPARLLSSLKGRFVVLQFAQEASTLTPELQALVDSVPTQLSAFSLPLASHREAARLLGVTAPATVLLDTEGRLISKVLQGDELLQRLRQILSGDLYYLDQKDDQE